MTVYSISVLFFNFQRKRPKTPHLVIQMPRIWTAMMTMANMMMMIMIMKLKSTVEMNCVTKTRLLPKKLMVSMTVSLIVSFIFLSQ